MTWLCIEKYRVEKQNDTQISLSKPSAKGGNIDGEILVGFLKTKLEYVAPRNVASQLGGKCIHQRRNAC